MKNILEYIQNPPSKYRPVPFWSWNTKLDTEETKRQVKLMHECGMGGFFMHARGGLTTEYLGKEWMENIDAGISQANEFDMLAWGYDENGWPSGFGNDAVNSLGVEYRQKYLRMEYTTAPVECGTTITNTTLADGRNAHFYYEVNPHYVDTLDKKVTLEFIKSTHQRYKDELCEKFNKMAGFFTDEPQVSRNGIPWSFIREDEYRKAYGDELLPRLYDLFCDTQTGSETRFRFWKLVTHLFSENYMGTIYQWCNNNGVLLTGHMVLEEGIHTQLESNGAVMPCYEYMHIPGIDKLGLVPDRHLLAPQVTSVCAQLGKKQILTESFAMCGWDVSFEELKHIYEWQMVKGVNLLCQHLVPYSLEGLRKRDYPAGHFYQNPWWDEYKVFNDFASRMGMLLSEGQIKCDILVLHTMSSGWTLWHGDDKEKKTSELHHKLSDLMTLLDKNGVLFHLGDDKILKKYGSVDGRRFVVGKMSYSTVIVPPSCNIDSNTLLLLTEFSKNGGNVIFTDEIPHLVDGKKSDKVQGIIKKQAQSLCDILKFIPQDEIYCKVLDSDGNNADIQYAVRDFGDFSMYYLVNTFCDKTDVSISFKGKSVAVFDAFTGQIHNVSYTCKDGKIELYYTFEKMGSVVFFVRDDELYTSKCEDKKELVSINQNLYGRWEIARSCDNVLTLDKCDLYFDGELVRKNAYILDVQQLACDLKRKVRIAMDFDIDLDRNIPDRLQLVMENPEKYMIYINGQLVEKRLCGYFRDKSFKILDITGLLEKGYNILTLECTFLQSDEVYDTLDKCCEFESVKNKLYYDMEIEPVYLVGEFAVNCDREFCDCENGIKTDGKFSITKRPFHICDGDIAIQGFPFFCGSMTLKKAFTLEKSQIHNRSIDFSRLCSTVTKISVNGKDAGNIFTAPYTVNLSGLLNEGENTVEITLLTSMRNMLGPHHLGDNIKTVSPATFHYESRIWGADFIKARWENDSYSFSPVGIFLK